MIDIYSELKSINDLIKELKFDEAEERLTKLRGCFGAKKFKIQINLLKRKIDEKKRIYRINSSTLCNECKSFYRYGKLNEYYSDYYIAYQNFLAGYYVTNDLSFIFHAAVCQYLLDNHDQARDLFYKYIDENGYKYLAQCYFFLAALKYSFTAAERNEFHKKFVDINNYKIQFNDGINFKKVRREEPFYYSYNFKK